MKKSNILISFIVALFISYFSTYLICMLIHKEFHNVVFLLILKGKYLNSYLLNPILGRHKPIVIYLFITTILGTLFSLATIEQKKKQRWINRPDLDRYGSTRFAKTKDLKEWSEDKHTDIKLVAIPSYKQLGEEIFNTTKFGLSSSGAVLGKTTKNPTNKNNKNTQVKRIGLKEDDEEWIINTGDNSSIVVGGSRSGKGQNYVNPTLQALAMSCGKINLNSRRDKDIFKNPEYIPPEKLTTFKDLKPLFSEWFLEIYNNYQVYDEKTNQKVDFFKRFPIEFEHKENQCVGEMKIFIQAPNQNVLVPDFKGELFQQFGGLYAKRGYNVILMDLINPLSSSSFNFLSDIRDSYLEYITTWYELQEAKTKNDNAQNVANLNKKMRMAKSDADSSLSKIGLTIFPKTGSADNDLWIGWARSLFQGTAFITLIEMIHKAYNEKDHVLKQRLLNSINMNSITNTFNNGIRNLEAKGFYAAEKFCKRNPMIQTSDRFLSDLESFFRQPESTQGNILNNYGDETTIFSTDIKYCFSHNDFYLDDVIGFIPTAIFISIPEDKSLYKFATLFIDLLWDKIRTKTKKMKGKERLPINMNVILDEFGNLPKISGMTEQMAAGLSMGVRTHIIVQTPEQLENKYKKDEAKTIINNCRNFIYVEAADEETRSWFSKRLGNMTIEEQTWIPKIGQTPAHWDNKIVSRPLITPEELLNENKSRSKFDMVVQYLNKPTIYTRGIVYFNFEEVSALRSLTYTLFGEKQLREFETFNILIYRWEEKQSGYDDDDIIRVKSFVPLDKATSEEMEANFEIAI